MNAHGPAVIESSRKALTPTRRSALERRLWQAFFLALFAAVLAGWRARERLPSPEDGVGYWLGIAGTTLMVLLLFYPLRKKLGAKHWSGSVGFWFRFHMVLGLLGPLAILYHSRFTYSATNSGIAALVMLVVVASGLTGRFLYKHIYRGFSQRKLDTRELFEELAQWRVILDADGEAGHDAVQQLEDLERLALRKRNTLIGNLVTVAQLAVRSRLLYFVLLRRARLRLALNQTALGIPSHTVVFNQAALRDHLYQYLRSIRELGGFAFYDRVFNGWHYLHLPLFVLLLGATTLHVVAVHMY